jgi:hypothetical protein
MKKKIIAYSLFGEGVRYWKGAILNIELAAKYYPDWICRFYIDKNAKKELLDTIKGDNVEIVLMDNKGGFSGTMWRFLPAEDDDVEVFLSRDTDSRIYQREVDAVNEWLKSDKNFHIMRDNPYHCIEILAGMFGVKNPLLKGIVNYIDLIKDFSSKFVDQILLKNIYYQIYNQCMEHCDYDSLTYRNELKKFPSPIVDEQYVGRCYGEEFYE